MGVSTRNSSKRQADSQTTDQGPLYNGSGNSSGTPHSGSLSPLSELEEDQANSTAQPDPVDEARSPRSPPIEIAAASGTKATDASKADSAAGGCALEAGSTEDSSHDGVVSTEVAQATQSAYRKFLGGFSLSPASSSSQTASSSTTTTTEDDLIAVSLFTPLGSRLPYFSDPHRWNIFRPDSVPTTRISSESDIVKTLYLNASYANKRSVLLLEDPKYRGTHGRRMFLPDPDTNRADYSHVLLQVALLDRAVWCSLPSTTSNVRCNPDRPKRGAVIPEHAHALLTACRDWQPHLARAATQFLTHENLSKNPDPELASTTTSLDPDGAVASLGLRLAQSQNSTVVNHIEQNFIAAAIGLRALVEVSTSLTFFSSV